MTSVVPTAALPDATIAGTTPAGKSQRESKGGGLGTTVVMTLVALLWISPLVLLVITAVRPLADFISHGPLSWPSTLTLKNFADAWGIGNFATTYRNSAILLILKVPIGVFLSAMLAYALAKLRIRFGAAIMY